MVDVIVETVELLKKKINFEYNVTPKDGFWGQVCIALAIPNTKNNRYKLKRTFHKVSMFCLFQNINPDYRPLINNSQHQL